MNALLHFALKDAGARRLVISRSLQNMRRIDPVIYTAKQLSVMYTHTMTCQSSPATKAKQNPSAEERTSPPAHDVHARSDIVLVHRHIAVASAVDVRIGSHLTRVSQHVARREGCISVVLGTGRVRVRRLPRPNHAS